MGRLLPVGQAFLCLGLAGATAGTAALLSVEEVSFGRDIRPLLSNHCFQCHGPDPGARQENLRLDLREEATADRGGYAAIVPGDAEASEMWRRINADHVEDRMPPVDGPKPQLTEAEKELVRRWIEDGAVYEGHWAFKPPGRPPVPEVADSSWPRNSIDSFILSRLEREGLPPNPEESEPAKLLRRVFLDLTGLPPTPEEYAAFLADIEPGAYERWVDRILTEEPYVTRYAERMTLPWLDAARYADTNGIHMDAGRQMWAWRDWVLRAFRDNMPFDQFIIEQLAGDLLPDATLDQQVASGFHRNHVITDEGGAIDAEYLVEYSVDRVDTTGSVFMGLTVGCARCHDHKFDPVTQEDYYSLFAYFNSNDEVGLYPQVQDVQRAFRPFIQVPSSGQTMRLDALKAELHVVEASLKEPSAEDAAAYAEFLATTSENYGVVWAATEALAAEASAGSTMTIKEDGSVLVSGVNPDKEDHVLTFRTEGTNLRTLLFEALPDPSLPNGGVGRAGNSNAVMTGFRAEAVSVDDPALSRELNLVWAWADHEQPGSGFDYEIVNLLKPFRNDTTGWAVNAHVVPGGRTGLFLVDEPFGWPGGTELRITLGYQSTYAKHALGRVRVTPGTISDAGLDALPVADSAWYGTWPYDPESKYSGYDQIFGPEADSTIDFDKKYPPSDYSWVVVNGLADGKVNGNLPAGEKVSFAGKRFFVPSDRTVEFSLGSDDGVQVFLDGKQVFENRIDRGALPDQDRLTLDLTAGEHTLVLKIVNTGGVGGYYWEARPEESVLVGSTVFGLVKDAVRERGANDLATRVSDEWRGRYSPVFREKKERAASISKEMGDLGKSIPLTMVMRERAERRQTYVLMRGQYDQPDMNHPVERGIPPSLGALPEGAPDDRRGLAFWMTSPGNPLVSRVFVNRFWELVFGTGIVATSEDFGMQGEWPSHPELLDWLAVEFRESGWDVKAMMRLLVTSSTYRQSSNLRPEAVREDPGTRLLSSYPRRRLGAEEIRDQALHLSGLLVEQMGGPSVKPYQPAGLWEEIAMPQSNTRVFVRGDGDDLWRRSMYTYWKRACPPPSLLTLDAPTREFCTIRRSTTNTPLQALVLWNDPQFVEAARVLAQRTFMAAGEDIQAGINGMFLRCTGRAPSALEAERLQKAFHSFLERYTSAPEEATKLLEVGEAEVPGSMDAPKLAAWTLLANALLSLDEVITRT